MSVEADADLKQTLEIIKADSLRAADEVITQMQYLMSKSGNL
jgi:hypothetical protein